ncbi:MAG: 2-amino-4-hydroxy-6-hydroxymethyldihydropteridine diphosphokinase [Bacteroidales bacterium]|nr:2-amino-4-hydroxy-6-hydroxymethyldihydropteridine diphosphokinase [Bacteroidales bacterium]MDY2692278.1 2-amino-4-hydroxy-6-hydroxymethyldihydropteridine diphosphokinase [Prevotella sp.]MDY4730963.1 2-amino-4-hydroxy-6-hydroxymethyldihydropteridine diphosphokinase [Prevotella sp.]
MSIVYLGLGSNLGNKEQHITTAVKHLEQRVGKVRRLSSLLKTEPWGFTSPHSFVNAAVSIDTILSPHEVLEATQQIERDMGREQKSMNGEYHDRIIDIDILLYDDMEINEKDLIIPHPLMHQRDFVMIPLREIFEE